MLLTVDDAQATALLGAAKTVAAGGAEGSLSDVAAEAIKSLAVLGLGVEAPEVSTLPATGPGLLTAALDFAEQVVTSIDILAVMALVDGALDPDRIGQVVTFADGLGFRPDWLEDLSLSLADDLTPVIEDMGGRNLQSVTDGRLELADIDDINTWLEPYSGDGQDDPLAQRYASLSELPPGSLGYEFWSFYDRHHFAFPGQPGAVNEIFGTPHDCTHLISGYDTTPQGELLVSTFTSRMHPIYPMAGHVLPVIYSWHLGIEFNKLAGSYRGALDPAKFWVAWDRGLQATADTFSREFAFWDHIAEPLVGIRESFGIIELDPAHAASSQGAVAGVDYRPIA